MLETEELTLFHFQSNFLKFVLKNKADVALMSAFFILIIGCAGPRPIEEHVLAQIALQSAKEAGAATLASGYWYKADESYRKGLEALKGNYNYEAKEHFISARINSEKAENATRLKKFKSGESYP